MKAHLLRFGVAAAMAIICFMAFVALQSLMAAHPIPALNAFIPTGDVAEARIITRIISPQIELNLALKPNDRLVSVVGHVQCDEGERVRINVNITQDTTGAHAVGHTQEFCTGEIQTWTALAVARGRTSFEEGAATACAVATTRRRNAITDTFSWCKAVNLVRR